MRSLPVVPPPDEREVPVYTADQAQLARDLLLISRSKLAETITGGLSWPSKMDCPAWGIPVEYCQTGMTLAKTFGTVCRECYAARGPIRFEPSMRKLRAAYAGIFHP